MTKETQIKLFEHIGCETISILVKLRSYKLKDRIPPTKTKVGEGSKGEQISTIGRFPKRMILIRIRYQFLYPLQNLSSFNT